MRLKSLQLYGFKSFADKTKLEFTRGITAVVGPNGCGKSNIADAFRWVFGEQSAKSMRSSKMLDVIFSGTTKRKPLNIAEVTITLTGASESLATEYEEIAVTRRLHRSGDSEYFLNDKLVRLKDVHSLFLDSGIGKISFFEQGKMDMIIQSTPLERRVIFEEAAGICRFLQRRQESLRQLDHMATNLEQVEIGHRELLKQITILEAQAEKAMAFKALKMEQQQLEKGCFLAKVQKTRKKKSEAEGKDALAKETLDSETIKMKSLQKQGEESTLSLVSIEKAFLVQSEKLFALRGDREVKRAEVRDRQERIKESRVKESRWKRELEDLLIQAGQHADELIDLKKKQSNEKTDFSALQQVCLEQKKNVDTAEATVNNLRQKQQLAHREKLTSSQAENQASTEMTQNHIRLEGCMEKFQHGESRKEKIVAMEKEFLELLKEKSVTVKALKDEIEQRREAFYVVEENNEQLKGTLKEATSAIEECRLELNEKTARHKALGRLKQEMSGFSIASKKLLAINTDDESPFYGKIQRLSECFTSDAGYEKALAAALKPYGQTLVVETIADIKELLSFAKQHNLSDFSLFARETICINESLRHTRSMPSKAELFTDHTLQNPLSRHFLENLIIYKNGCETDSYSLSESRESFWLEDGVFVDTNGVYFQASEGGSNPFLQEAELTLLAAAIMELEDRLKDRDSHFKKLDYQRIELHAELMTLDKNIRRTEMSLVEANFGLQRLNSDLEKNRKEQIDLDKEQKALRCSIDDRRELALEFAAKHQAAKEVLSAVTSQLVGLEEELLLHSDRLKRERQHLLEQEQIYQQALQGIHKSEHAIHLIEAKKAASVRQQERLQEELSLISEFLVDISAKDVAAASDLAEIEKLLLIAEDAFGNNESAVLTKKQAIAGLQKQILVTQDTVKALEVEKQRYSIEVDTQKTLLQNLSQEVKERYSLTLVDAEAQFPPLETTLEQAEKKARNLRQTIEAAGDINMTAIEECEKHKERHQFLTKQLEDLNASKIQLEQIISQLERESRKLFKETFELIAFNFRKNFAILFNGGEADLHFVGGDNMLEGGIDIVACPPGKQMRSISLLSGGEKCLTAMALLFAIFEVKVTPFCILDEIDAPLDDSNVERFANVVRQFTDRCQFIIITHNKRTMAIADLLCGVSMEEQGVSKLLQMEFVSELEFEAKVMAE